MSSRFTIGVELEFNLAYLHSNPDKQQQNPDPEETRQTYFHPTPGDITVAKLELRLFSEDSIPSLLLSGYKVRLALTSATRAVQELSRLTGLPVHDGGPSDEPHSEWIVTIDYSVQPSPDSVYH